MENSIHFSRYLLSVFCAQGYMGGTMRNVKMKACPQNTCTLENYVLF